MNILVIDTSLSMLGVAIISNDEILKEKIVKSDRKHSEYVMEEIKNILEEVNIKAKDLDKIIVTIGPGSYTGTRVGVTIAKTLAYLLDIPLVGISSLQAYSLAIEKEGYIIPIIDARGNTFYAGVYDKNYKPVIPDNHYTKEELLDMIKKIKGEITFIGDGLNIIGDSLNGEKFLNIEIVPGKLGLFAKDFPETNAHALKPNYLKLTDAEKKFNKGGKDA